MKHLLFLSAFLFLSALGSNAQLFQVPELVKQTFEKQFPTATDAKWSGGIDNHAVQFTLGEKKLKANYTPKAEWVSTEEKVVIDSLPLTVQENFKKSKYKDWTLKDAIIISKPRAEANEYRIVVQKSMLTKKLLVFDAKGRLQEELLAL
jgi:hypothetical protein